MLVHQRVDTLPFSNFQRVFFTFIKNTISFWHKKSEQMTWTVSCLASQWSLRWKKGHKIQPKLQVETSHALALKCATFSACEALGSCYPSCWDKKKGMDPPNGHIESHWAIWKLVKIWNHVYRVCRVYLRWVETIIQYSWLHRQLSAGISLRGLACNHSSALCSHFPALWAWTPNTIPTYSDHSPDAPCGYVWKWGPNPQWNSH